MTKTPKIGDTALIIVESPFQLLCAYEIITRYRLNYILAIRKSGLGRNDEQLKMTAEALGLHYVEIVVRVRKFTQDILRAWPQIFSILARSYNHLLLGSYYSGFIRMLRRGIRADRTWLLDDGLASLKAQSDMIKSGRIYDLATCLELQELPGQTILQHRLESVAALNSIIYTEDSLFIGQPFVEKGIVSNAIYNDILGISRRASANRLTYIPHRAENTQRVVELQRTFDLDIHYPSTCIELDLVQRGQAPLQVFNVLSTAAFTIARMFPRTTVTIFPAPLKGVSPPWVEIIEYAYSIDNMNINNTVAARAI